jgi:hypothetical protein
MTILGEGKTLEDQDFIKLCIKIQFLSQRQQTRF